MLNTNKKIIVEGFILTVLGMIFSKSVTYLWRILLAHAGPETYGLVTLGMTIMNLLIILGTLGSTRAVGRVISRWRAEGKEEKEIKAVYAVIFISIPLTLLVSFLAIQYSHTIALLLFKNVHVAPLIVLSAIALPFFILYRISLGIVSGYKLVRVVVLSQRIINNLFKILSLIFFFYVLHKIAALYGYLSWIVGEMCAFAVLFYYAIKSLSWSFSLPTLSEFKEVLRYGFPLFLSSTLGALISNMDILFINYVVSAYAVGIYSAAYPTAQLLLTIPSALGVALVPIFVELSTQKKYKEYRDLARWVTKYNAILNTFVFAVFFLYSDEIMMFLFGREYASAGILLKILSIGFYIHAINHTSKYILYAQESTMPIFFISILALIYNFALNYVFVKVWGTIGIAIATTISILLNTSLVYYQAYKYSRIQHITKSIFLPLAIAFSIMILTNRVLHIFYTYLPLWVGVLSLVFDGITYLVVLVMFRVIDIKEIIKMGEKYLLNRVKHMRNK